MKDIQSQYDTRRINIKKVGVKNIAYPISLRDKAKSIQHTIAKVNMYVNLPHHFKGTHMSRFIEILNQVHGEINLKSFHNILLDMKKKLQAEAAHLEIEFPYFLDKKDQPTNSVHIGEYRCKMHGSLQDVENLTVEIRVPIAPPVLVQANNVLPRSLGHWGFADVCIKFKHFIWIEDIIHMVEDVTCHKLKWSAEYGNGKDKDLSVEQLTSELGKKLADHENISWFRIAVENLSEGFSTFATLEWPSSCY